MITVSLNGEEGVWIDNEEGETAQPYWELPNSSFIVHPMECCGWFLVSSFSYNSDHLVDDNRKALQDITNNLLFCYDDPWSYVEDEYTHFTLTAVLTKYQLSQGWGELLKECGWKRLTSFFNPNTGNTCVQFIRHIEETKV